MTRPPRPAAARGFTLIEMAIVLLVAVLGFAVLGNNIASGNHATKLQAVARDIASALRYAHGQALLTGKTAAVTISLADNSYRVDHRDKTYAFAEDIDVSLVVAEEEFADGEQGSIRFFGDGSSTGGRITLEWGNLSKKIDVNWITGEVAISAVEPDLLDHATA
ncbi:GspH/FimT family pseudopilin [Methylomonas sp. MED-D]|uniref:Type II secretion system protein H n=1 Tax=Methylomonas koyamae TaxID=702114 RepID=A0A177NPQ7_9GAMM|nr:MULTISPECIES: GspH/FimT family pseudopilin [Methylomonas]OAI19313.1 type II secretion system protein GspH [Methylomonas koyamae]WGS84621.1 GspH/FimT family pseudopilin [Methylomonas sp. UP202]